MGTGGYSLRPSSLDLNGKKGFLERVVENTGGKVTYRSGRSVYGPTSPGTLSRIREGEGGRRSVGVPLRGEPGSIKSLEGKEV